MTFGIMEDDGPACCMPMLLKGDPVTSQGKRLDEEVRWKDGSGSFGR